MLNNKEKQLNIFEENEDPLWEDPLWEECRDLKVKQDNLRKGIFQRYSALLSLVESLQSELIEVRAEIRKNRKDDFPHSELLENKKT